MIWQSRKFWGVVLPLVVLAVCQAFPSFHLDTEAATGCIIVIAGYVLSVAVDPGANAGTLWGVLASRKFWAAAVGLLAMILDGFGLKLPASLPPETIIYLATAVFSYMGGVAIEGVRAQTLGAPVKSRDQSGTTL